MGRVLRGDGQVIGRHLGVNYTGALEASLAAHLSGIDSALGVAANVQGGLSDLPVAWATTDTYTIGEGEALASASSTSPTDIIKVPGAGLTADLSTSGANGLDTGVRAVDTWYHLYIIKGTSGVASLWSLSATAPTLPTGYVASFRRVGAAYNIDDTGTGDLVEMTLIRGGRDRLVLFDAPAVDGVALTAGSSASPLAFSALDLSAFCAPGSDMVRFVAHVYSPAPGAVAYFRKTGSSATLGQIGIGASFGQIGSWLEVAMSAGQSIDYALSDTVARVDVYILGYHYTIGGL